MSEALRRIRLGKGEWSAEILPDYSCSLISLCCGGESIIRSPKSDEDYIKSHIVYGTAFLLPPDRTIGGSFAFEGREYHLPINDSRGLSNIHGLMSDAAFEIVSLTESEAVLKYSNRGERYPFDFDVTVKYSLDDGCRTEYVFENTGERNMPILFGLHTNFADLGYVRVPVEGEMIMNAETLVPDMEIVSLGELGKQLDAGMKPTGIEISSFFTSRGNTAEIGDYTYTVSDTFTHWVLWNGNGNEGFISVEPENGPVNGLKYEGVCQVIEKGKSISFTTDLRRKNK